MCVCISAVTGHPTIPLMLFLFFYLVAGILASSSRLYCNNLSKLCDMMRRLCVIAFSINYWNILDTSIILSNITGYEFTIYSFIPKFWSRRFNFTWKVSNQMAGKLKSSELKFLSILSHEIDKENVPVFEESGISCPINSRPLHQTFGIYSTSWK